MDCPATTTSPRLPAGRALLGLTLLLGGCWGGGAPTVEVLQEAVSPDGRHVATSFYCEGGGAAGYTFHNVSLRPSEAPLDPMDGLLGKHRTWNSFGGVDVRWRDATHLEVSYRALTDDEEQLTEVGERHGVRIHYTRRP